MKDGDRALWPMAPLRHMTGIAVAEERRGYPGWVGSCDARTGEGRVSVSCRG